MQLFSYNCRNCEIEFKSKSRTAKFCSKRCWLAWTKTNFNPIWKKKLKNWKVLDFSHRQFKLKRIRYWWKAQCKNCRIERIKNADDLGKDRICQNCKNRPRGHSGLLALYWIYKTYCGGKRNLRFNLSLRQFKFLTSKNCHYCGRKPFKSTSSENEWGQYVFNGIDRRNPKIGYNTKNTVPCCETCNVAKSDMPYNEFISYLDNLVNFRKGKTNE